MGTKIDEEHYLKKELYSLVQGEQGVFEFLQRGSLDGIWYWDLENPTNEWMSPEFWTTLGYNPATKKHECSEWQEFIFPGDLVVAQKNFQLHCENPEHHYDQTVRYRHKDGSTVWVRCRGLAIRDSAGKAIRMLGAHTNITELKKTEAALLKRTEELEKLNESLQATLDRVVDGILPVCSYCRRVRDQYGEWQAMEILLTKKSGAKISHGLCDECFSSVSKLLPPEGPSA